MHIENYSSVDSMIIEIGSRIKRVRIDSQFTQEDLAVRAGVSLSSIARLETGHSLQLDTMLRILKALNVASMLEAFLPQDDITPMQAIRHESPKKTYRRSKASKQEWTWGDN